MIGLAALGLFSCKGHPSPEAAFEHATGTFRHGRLAGAAQEAEEGYKQFRALSPEWAWKFRTLQANILYWQGLSEDSLSLLRSETTTLPSGELAIQVHRLESLAYVDLHRFPEAVAHIEAADKLCAAISSVVCADVLGARATLELRQGHFDQARRLLAEVLEMDRRFGDQFRQSNVMLSLSNCALEQERFDEAMSWANSSYRLAAALDSADVAQNALGNLGWAYYKLGEPDKAAELFQQARQQAVDLGDMVDQVKWLTTMGYIYLDAQNHSEAQNSYEKALDLAQQIHSEQDIIDALVSLALVFDRTGNLDRAHDYADRTIAMVPKDGNRLDMLYPMLVKGHVAARQHDTQQAEKIYREIERDTRSHVFLKWEAEHSLAQLYEEENEPDAAEREYRSALTTFEGARAALHEDTSLPFPANAAGIYDDYIRFLIGKKKLDEALRVAEYQRGRTLAEGLGLLPKETAFRPEALNAQTVARKVGGTVLFYWLGEKQSYLWAITPERTSIFILPPKAQIEPIAQRYRKALAEQQEFLERTRADGLALYKMLIEPAASLLKRDGRVFVIPDGSLNTLNFETLLVPGSTPHYWIEDVTITDASSLRLLAATRTGQKRSGNLLLFGNAVAPNADYPELRNAAMEMESIGKSFPETLQQIFAREQATPAAYLSGKPEEFSYIHFVAHGTASQTSPLDSAIVLSKSGPQDDSFKLYARDIIRHPLGAQLVTISTCYGAGARAYSGEGLVGLSWAFLRAGAHNVIGALWEVSDVSTPQLMGEMYRQLEEGKGPDDALRNAKLTLLRSSSYTKPFYWAPFQLYTGS